LKNKPISLAIPEVLYKESKKYSEKYAYKSLQEFILDLLRKKVILKNIERYEEIEKKARSNGRRMSQKEAVSFLEKM